jgi:hypothetical protein
MKPRKRTRFAVISILSIACSVSAFAGTYSTAAINTLSKKIAKRAPNMSPEALKLGLRAYDHARMQGLDKQRLLTIVDFTKPSYDKRIWVINLNNDRIDYHTFVSQGTGSGGVYAKHFSNKPGTDTSSLGVYLTGMEYAGKHPDSMKLHGLDKGFNNNAYRREIVMHPAAYAGRAFIRRYGYLGRSWGCFAINTRVEPSVVKTIKNGTIIFAYYPDKKLEKDSAYLQPLTSTSKT